MPEAIQPDRLRPTRKFWGKTMTNSCATTRNRVPALLGLCLALACTPSFAKRVCDGNGKCWDDGKVPELETLTVTGTRPSDTERTLLREAMLRYLEGLEHIPNYAALFGRESGGGGGEGFSGSSSDDGNEGQDPCDSSSPSSQNPVVFSTGNKLKREVDFVAAGQRPFGLVRNYNKNWGGTGMFGPAWITPFEYGLSFEYSDSTLVKVYLRRADGARITYQWNAAMGHWTDDKPAPVATLGFDAETQRWTHNNESKGVETYDSAGKVLAVTDQYGLGWTFN